MENLRAMLSQYNPEDSLYFGHRYTKTSFPEGYMAGRVIQQTFYIEKMFHPFLLPSGGGYILSKKALKIFIEDLLPTDCGGLDGENDIGNEDFSMGICLTNHSIFVDCRDEKQQKRFFPVGMEHHTWFTYDFEHYWYFQDLYYKSPQGGLDCCSEKSVQFHYIGAGELYQLDYLIYKVHPFGIADDPSLDLLPPKLTLEEILASSNAKSERRKHKEMGLDYR